MRWGLNFEIYNRIFKISRVQDNTVVSTVFTTFPSTLQEHNGRVFRLQFDDFQIVSSSHDDTILMWDFLNYTPDQNGKTTVSTLR